MLPADPFGRSRLPADFSRESRVQMLAEVFQALLEDRSPSREAAVFVAGAGLAWLENGGDLLRDYLKVKAPRASTHTPTVVYRRLQECSSRRATEPGDIDNLERIDTIEVEK